MHKIVLLAVNAKYIHSSLSVWALASGVSHYARTAAETAVVECTINQPPALAVAQVAAHAPQVVGISSYIWNASMLPTLLSGLRAALPKAVLVLGGPEASFQAEHWLLQGADYVLCGEGERSFPALVDALFTPAPLSGIPGLCWLEAGRLRSNPQAPLAETPPNPHTPAWFAALGGRIAYLETSRGCPFSCAFCLSGQDTARFFPLAYAKQQLTALAGCGAKTIKLVDRTFNCNASRAYALFSHVIELDTDCCFHFEVAADLFDARTVALLQTAPPGRIQLEAGLQSFYAPTLQAVSRRTNLPKAAQNLRALLAGGNIHIHVDLIAGLPLESFAEFQNSFNSAYALGAHQLQLGFLKLLHGSALRRDASQWGIVYAAQPPYEILQSGYIRPEELDILRLVEDALEHAYNSGRFPGTLRYVLDASGLQPFALYRGLGQAVPHGGMPLFRYAEKLFAYFSALPGVQAALLRDAMVCDLLAGAKGESLPPALRLQNPAQHKWVVQQAAAFWGHAVPRRETALLASRPEGVFVGEGPHPVTGRYALHFVALPKDAAQGQGSAPE